MFCLFPAYSLDAYYAALTLTLFESSVELCPVKRTNVPLLGKFGPCGTIAQWVYATRTNMPPPTKALGFIYTLGSVNTVQNLIHLNELYDIIVLHNKEPEALDEQRWPSLLGKYIDKNQSLCQIVWSWFTDTHAQHVPKTISLLAELKDLQSASDEAIGFGTYLVSTYNVCKSLKESSCEWYKYLSRGIPDDTIAEGIRMSKSAQINIVF